MYDDETNEAMKKDAQSKAASGDATPREGDQADEASIGGLAGKSN
jgi:hypothetical protein